MYKNKTLWLIILAVSVIPAVVGLLYIYKYGVNVPYWDQWDSEVPLLKHFFEGSLHFSELFSQHNESRPFFPRILMLVIALATKLNIISEMFFAYALYCLSCLVLFLMFKKDHQINEASLLMFIPITLSFFNLYQMSNMLFGIRISQSMTILFFFLSVYLIDSSKRLDRRFIFSIITSIVSSFSFIAGMTVWPVCFVQILINKNDSKKKKLIIWTISSMMVFMIYMRGYSKPVQHPQLDYFLSHILEAFLFFFTSIGSSVVRDLILSPILGIMIIFIFLITFIMIKYNNDLTKNSKWIALVIFSMVISLEMAVARSGFEDINLAISQRYFLFTFLNVIGLYFMTFNTFASQVRKSLYFLNLNDKKIIFYTLLFLATLALIIVGISFDFVDGHKEGQEVKESREQIAYYLETYETQTDQNLMMLHPIPEVIRVEAPFLKKYGLSTFAQEIDINKLNESRLNTLYAIDLINNFGNIQNNSAIKIVDNDNRGEITITGWAVDESANTPAKAVFVSIDDKLNILTRYGLDRADVAKFYKNNNYRYSGFNALFATSTLEKGIHNLIIKVVSSDRKNYYRIDPKVKLEIEH